MSENDFPAAQRQALSGLRVLDLSQGVAGPVGAKMLADFGAEVIKVEPTGGDDARRRGPFLSEPPDLELSASFLALNRNKLGVTLDLHRPAGRALLDELARESDAIIVDLPPNQLRNLRLMYDNLSAVNPALVVTAVTPWGLDGPYANYRASEIVLDAFGHTMATFGQAERGPLMLGGEFRQHYAGQFVGLATLAACTSAQQSGLGQQVDVSMVEAQLGSADRRAMFLLRYQYTGALVGRPDVDFSGGTYPVADGWVMVSLRPQLWPTVAALVGLDDGAEPAAVMDRLADWLSARTRRQVLDVASQLGLSVVPINGYADLLDDPHLMQRDFWVEEEHEVAGRLRHVGAPFRMAEGGYRSRTTSPRLGQHNAVVYGGLLGKGRRELTALADAGVISPIDPSEPLQPGALTPRARPAGARAAELPLTGIRVLDMTAVWAGPAATALLADLGAEVIRVESLQFFTTATRGHWPHVTRADLERGLLPVQDAYVDFDPGPRPWNRFAGFNGINRNKLSMTADLRRASGIDIFLEMVRHSDVVVDNYGVDVMDKLGLGHAQLSAENPRIVAVSMPMFGMTGPLRSMIGAGSVVDAWSGMLAARNYADADLPDAQSTTHMDGTTPPSVAFAVLCALRWREHTGRGQSIDFGQAENLLQAIDEYVTEIQGAGRRPEPLGNRDRHGGIQGCYPCRDADSWVVLTVRSDTEWLALTTVLDRADLRADARLGSSGGRYRHHDEIDAAVAQWTSERPAIRAMHTLQRAGIPAAKVMNEADAYQDTHLRERGFFVPMTLPDAGTHEYPGAQFRMLRTPLRVDGPAPGLGEHNSYVYRHILGRSDHEYAELAADGHIGDAYLPDIPPRIGLARADARPAATSTEPETEVSSPRAVAILGASESTLWTYWLMKNLKDYGYPGAIWPVNPNRSSVYGVATFASVQALPATPDTAVVITGAKVAPGVVNELVGLGVRDIAVVSDGFAETGTEEGIAYERAIVASAAKSGARIVGPNCVGYASFHDAYIGIAEPLPDGLEPGEISVISQSGSLTHTALGILRDEGLGFDMCYSIGNGAVIGLEAACALLAERATTRIVCAVVESISDRHALTTAVTRGRERGVEFVFLLLARSDQGKRAARSHTGAVTGDHRVIKTWMRGLDVTVVDSMEEMGRAAHLIARVGRPAPGRGLFVLAASGGATGLAADLASIYNLPLAELSEDTRAAVQKLVLPGTIVGNPLDTTTHGGRENTRRIYQLISADPAVGLLLDPYGITFPDESHDFRFHRAGMENVVATVRECGIPLIYSSIMAQPKSPLVERLHAGGGITVVNGLAVTLSALSRMYRRDVAEPSADSGPPRAALDRLVVDEDAARAVLSDLALPVVEGVSVGGPDQAAAAATTMPGPWVVKLALAGLGHKGRVGGVRLGLVSAEQVEEACRSIRESVAASGLARAEDIRFMVQRMVFGPELLVGFVRDDVAGPSLIIGVGGWAAETGTIFAAVPLDVGITDFAAELRRSTLGHLIGDARLVELIALLAPMSESFVSGPLAEYDTVECNPVIMSADGPRIADVLLVRRAAD